MVGYLSSGLLVSADCQTENCITEPIVAFSSTPSFQPFGPLQRTANSEEYLVFASLGPRCELKQESQGGFLEVCHPFLLQELSLLLLRDLIANKLQL